MDRLRRAAATGNVTLRGCKWVWYPEGDPRISAPAGSAYFRHKLQLPAGRIVRSATFLIAADDECALWINGALATQKRTGEGGWKTPVRAEVAQFLREGANTIAVEGINAIPSPAGLIGRLVVQFDQGEPLRVAIDGKWKAARKLAEGWQKADFNDDSWPAAREIATEGDTPWGKIGNAPQDMLPPPLLRKDFSLQKEVKRATLYATALGLYEVSINGRRVGRDVLAPGWSDYPKRVYYFTYDVTGLVKSGNNAIGAILGDGWYGSYLAFTGKRRFYGGAPRLMLQLNLELADGTNAIVATDETWKAGQGPIVYADLLMGESYDARKEICGWAAPGFDDGAWKPVSVSSDLKMAVEAHPGLPIRPQEELAAKQRTEPKPGNYVYDLGQNMVGWVRLKLEGKAGQQVRLRHAEMLNPDGTIYTANLRAARHRHLRSQGWAAGLRAFDDVPRLSVCRGDRTCQAAGAGRRDRGRDPLRPGAHRLVRVFAPADE